MKICFKCKEEKPLSDFYRHRGMKDGHLNKCIDCVKLYEKDRRQWNGEYIRQYDRDRNKLPHRREAIDAYQKTPRGKEVKKKCSANWIRKNPVKRAAQYILRNAVRDGKISKPSNCSICGISGRIHGHHDDYTKPLDVIWCCSQCHANIHEFGRIVRRKFRRNR